MRFLALLSLLLVACAAPPPGAPITAAHLSNTLDSQWPGYVPKVTLADYEYEIIAFPRVIRAALDAKRQWKEEVWDCDDQVASALHRLRVKHQHDGLRPPAVGRIRGIIHTGELGVHDMIWCLDSGTGTIRLYDATYLFEPALKSIKPIELTDF